MSNFSLMYDLYWSGGHLNHLAPPISLIGWCRIIWICWWCSLTKVTFLQRWQHLKSFSPAFKADFNFSWQQIFTLVSLKFMNPSQHVDQVAVLPNLRCSRPTFSLLKYTLKFGWIWYTWILFHIAWLSRKLRFHGLDWIPQAVHSLIQSMNLKYIS